MGQQRSSSTRKILERQSSRIRKSLETEAHVKVHQRSASASDAAATHTLFLLSFSLFNIIKSLLGRIAFDSKLRQFHTLTCDKTLLSAKTTLLAPCFRLAFDPLNIAFDLFLTPLSVTFRLENVKNQIKLELETV